MSEYEKVVGFKPYEIWQTKGLISVFVAMLMAVGLYHTITQDKVISLITLFSLSIIWISIWLLNNRIKKTKKGKLGILICIHSKDYKVDLRIREDFISALERSLIENDIGNFSEIKVIPYHISLRYKNSDEAIPLLSKTRSQYLLFGTVRKRKDKFVLDLVANVRHIKLTDESTEDFKRDISSAWVTRYNLDKADSNFELFELTSELISLFSKYIIALAAFASKNFSNSEVLFVKIRDSIKNREYPEIPAVRAVRTNTTMKLNSIYILQMQECLRIWNETHEVANVLIMKQMLKKIFGAYKKDGRVLTYHAIVSVVLDDDFYSAKKYLLKINKKHRDAIWYLNYGFVEACMDNDPESIRHYEKAVDVDIKSDNDLDLNKVSEFENFILWFLKSKRNSPFLYFLLGFLNENFKGDLKQAEKDYKEFLDKVEYGMFPKSVAIAESIIDGSLALEAEL